MAHLTLFRCNKGGKAAIVLANSDDSYSVIIETGEEIACYLGQKSAVYHAKLYCGIV